MRQENPSLASPPACSYQDRLQGLGGKPKVLCVLPDGACSLQDRQAVPGGRTETTCRDPEGVPNDWQMLDVAALPAEDVRHFMTADPVTVNEGADIRTIARLMTDALVHRVVVIDAQNHPVGVVSGTDLIAALVYASEPEAVHQCNATR